MKIKALVFAVSALTSSSLLAAGDYANEPVYDCTRTETALYIKQVSYNVFAPTRMTSPNDFEKAVVVQSEESGGSCSTIFSDGKLDDAWKDTIESLRNIDLMPDLSSINAAAMQRFLDMAKDRIQAEIASAVDQLGQDICEMMATDNLEKLVLKGVHKKYGNAPRALRMDAFVDTLTEEALLKADRDIVKMVSDDEALADWMGDATRSELRESRRELWQNF